MYGNALKSVNTGNLFVPQTLSNSSCAFFWTQELVARKRMLVRIVRALVSAAACIKAPTKFASFVPSNAGSESMFRSSSKSSIKDTRLFPRSRLSSTRFRAVDHILVGISKPCLARVVELSHRFGIHLKIGNCSVGRYEPGLNAMLTCKVVMFRKCKLCYIDNTYRFHGLICSLH